MEPKTKYIRAIISGKVQGVYFRVFTRQEAERLQLCGWVRNLPSGEVEAFICGPMENVAEMIDWLATGSPQSRVDHVAVEELAATAIPPGFTILS